MDLDSLYHLYHQLVPLLKKQNKLTYIAAAISLILCQRIYKLLVLPQKLQHLPVIGFWKLAASLISRESVADRNKRLIYPVTSQSNGFYVDPAFLDNSCYQPRRCSNIVTEISTYLLEKLGKKSPIVQFIGLHNVAIVNGEEWKNQRKVMNPAFRRAMPVRTFGSLMPKVFDRIEKDKVVVAPELMQRLTLEALGITVFGFDFNALDDEESVWVTTYSIVRKSFLDPLPNIFASSYHFFRWFIPGRVASIKATDRLNGLLMQMAQKRREELKSKSSIDFNDQENDSEKDLLTLMLEAEMRGEGIVSDEALQSNLAVFFLAGHDTTSNALSFCLYHLATNKSVQDKAREEVLSILGDEPVDVFPTSDECKKMKYLDMIVKENLRMMSPADQLFSREAQEDVYLDGTLIPRGSRISVDVAAIQRDPSIWEDPDTFNPDRFMADGEYAKHAGLTWLPFSNGTRQCLGMNFSLAEQHVVLSMLLRKYTLELPADSIHKDNVVMKFAQNVAPNTLIINFTKRY